MAPAPAAGNLPEYTVGELSAALKRTLEDAYGYVRVRGEISGLKLAASGHLYLTLKDDQACLDGVCWRGTRQRFAFKPEDGLEVVCTGRVTTFPSRSKYQLVIDSMAPAGIGALMALLEERKKKLAAEGLFDAERKRPLPFLPEVIGVVTSPSGAVIRDILHRVAERFPRRVIVWPVLVQGEGAAEQVAAAIQGFDGLPEGGPVPRPDVVIVARGGGSLEDLWAFNEEAVVRAAAACRIPLISAVGHETDTTLIDLAADRRAPTPTAAAEMAVPVRAELLRQLVTLGERQAVAVESGLVHRLRHVEGLGRGLPDPELLLANAFQRLDDRAERLPRAVVAVIERRQGTLAKAEAGLRTPRQLLDERTAALGRQADRLGYVFRAALGGREAELRRVGERLNLEELRRRLPRHAADLGQLAARAGRAVAQDLRAAGERLAARVALFESLNYRSVLARGFALVRDQAGEPVTRAEAARRSARLELEFADGRVRARPEGSEAKPAARRAEDETLQQQGQLL